MKNRNVGDVMLHVCENRPKDLITSRFKKSSVKAFTNCRILSKYFPNFGIFRKKLKEAGLKQSASEP